MSQLQGKQFLEKVTKSINYQTNIKDRKINHIHERSLRIGYRDYNSYFKDLLKKKDNSVCIHHRNIQSLAVELFKVTENFSNTIKSNIFLTRVLNYNLRSQADFLRNTVSKTFYIESLEHDTYRN